MQTGPLSVGLVTTLLWVGCAAGPPRSDEPRLPRLELLASEVLRNTPEHTHFAPETEFSWVYLQPTIVAPPALAAEVERLMVERYKVFKTHEEIPEDLLSHVDAEGREHSMIRDGFYFSYEVESISPERVRITYRDYEGPLAASGRSVVYVWSGVEWTTESVDSRWIS